MIKINLLPQKRAKLRLASTPTAEAGNKHALIAGGALVAAAAGVFLIVDMPRRSRIDKAKQASEKLQEQIAQKRVQLAGYDQLKKAEEDAKKRAASIHRLMSNKAIPAHMLHELGEILTSNRLPAMTEDMRKRVGTGAGSDPNKRFQLDWDPTKVWISGFTDKDGVFKLDGGAQSESDVTQLSKRLQASVYFSDVIPAGGERVVDRDRGLSYYRFTITGKLAY